MSGPPPCTTIGFRPTYLSSTTSRANSSRSAGSSIAAPPYLITTVLPWNSRMYGSASSSVPTISHAQPSGCRLMGDCSSCQRRAVSPVSPRARSVTLWHPHVVYSALIVTYSCDEVGEEHLGLGALAGQARSRTRSHRPAAPRRARPRRSRSPCRPSRRACPRSRGRAQRRGTSPRRQRRAGGLDRARPQLGSAPCSAVLTSGELATAARDRLDALGVPAVHDDPRDPLARPRRRRPS